MQTIEQIKQKSQNIICVVGCGGNRDKKKRPIMAQISIQHSKTPIFTSDNPRSEDPGQIIEDMLQGLNDAQKKEVLVIPDRTMAIKAALNIARTEDIVLIAGKGHEMYQEIDGVKHPFSDEAIVRTLLPID